MGFIFKLGLIYFESNMHNDDILAHLSLSFLLYFHFGLSQNKDAIIEVAYATKIQRALDIFTLDA